MSHKRKLVVIGNGMAGARAVEEILARGGAEQFEITMFGDEPYGNYNRILLSNVLNGSQDASEIFLNPLAWYDQHHITLNANVRVTAIDRDTKHVCSADGRRTPYDQLIIATGSRPFVPRIDRLMLEDGSYRPGVFVFRTIDDCNQIRSYASKVQQAAVIGGGLLGLEAARGLMNYGCGVHIIQLMPYLMNQQLDAQAGGILQNTMEEMGVQVHLNKVTTHVVGEKAVSGLAFKDGTTLDCDMIVISAGITPNTELAAQCGLAVERAIVVDDQMRSITDQDIYVVGECAQHRGLVYGLVAPLWEQGKVLADHITKRNIEQIYQGSKLSTKLKVMGVDLASMGVVEPRDRHDEVIQFVEPRRGIYKKLIIRDDRLIGGILLGDTSKAGDLMQAFDRGMPLPEDRATLLFDIGTSNKKVTIGDMPESSQVCNCNGVSKGAIGACVLAGKRSPKAVMEATRAGMGCGSCRGTVQQIVEFFCDGAVEEDQSVHYYVPGVPYSKPDLIRLIEERELRSVSAVFEALAGGKEDPGSKPGLASLLKTIWKDAYEDERDARFINDRVHANIQKDGTFSVIPQIPGGITSSAQLRQIADVAEKYSVPMIKLTGGQRIDLLGVKKEELPQIWRDLDMPSGFAYSKAYRTCKSCVGSEFCRFGVGDSTTLAVKIEQRFQGIESPGKMKLATAGCPRNCSEAMVKDVGAVAIEGGKWEIYVGGAAGAHVRKGDVLCVVESHDDVLRHIGRFIQYYRQNAKYLERSYGFVERIGIQKLREILIDDSEGIAAQLDQGIQESIDAYIDPWKEAYQPATATQFASTLPVIEEFASA